METNMLFIPTNIIYNVIRKIPINITYLVYTPNKFTLQLAKPDYMNGRTVNIALVEPNARLVVLGWDGDRLYNWSGKKKMLIIKCENNTIDFNEMFYDSDYNNRKDKSNEEILDIEGGVYAIRP